MLKQEQHIIKGMTRDLSVSKFNPEFAYDCQNIRITTREDNTLLSVTNEKGNKEVLLKDKTGNNLNIDGILLGYNVLNNYVTLFTKGVKDNIYRLENKGNYFEVITLFSGDLNFNTKYPIENIGVYENLSIQKVYWIDGLNQTRVINITAEDNIISKWNKNSFDFVQNLKLKEEVYITRNDLASGLFSSGIIQYAFSYYNRYGQESNIFYTSPLHYTSFKTKGGSPEDKVSNSFNITINNADDSFDYVRIYSIQRTSIDATPTARIVADIPVGLRDNINIDNASSGNTVNLSTSNINDIKIYDGLKYSYLSDYNYSETNVGGTITRTYNIPISSTYYVLDTSVNFAVSAMSNNLQIVSTSINSGTTTFKVNGVLNYGTYTVSTTPYISYVDTGTTGSTIDPTELLYIGGENIVAKTLTQKDNTLFLGNIELKRPLISDSIRNNVKFGTVNYIEKPTNVNIEPKGFYPYSNTLYLGSEIKTFKYLEWYRFGLQFQFKDGKWSEPIWVNDSYNGPTSKNSSYSPSFNEDLFLAEASYDLPQNVINEAVSLGYVKVRGVVVYPNLVDREVIAQGILCPTVYNVNDRYNNSPFAQSSWFCRPSLAFDIEKNKNNKAGITGNPFDIENSKAAIISNTYITSPDINVTSKGAWAEFRDSKPIPNNWERNAEIQCIANTISDPFTNILGSNLSSYVANNQEFFFIDQSILNLYSPEIEFDDSIKNIDTSNLKLRIVGVIPMTSNTSDIDIQTSTPQFNSNKIGFYKEFVGSDNNSYYGLKSLLSGGFWIDQLTDLTSDTDEFKKDTAFFIYAWNRSGSLNNQGNITTGTRSAMLDKKKMSNLKFSSFSYYFNKPWNAYIEGDNNHTGITPVTIFNSKEQSLVRIPAPLNSDLGDLNYYGNVDKLIYSTRVNSQYTITYDTKTESFNRSNGYPIVYTGYNDIAHNIFIGASVPTQFLRKSNGDLYTNSNYGTDPVRIKYKTIPHAVFALNYSKNKHRVILPTNKETDGTTTWTVNDRNVDNTNLVSNDQHFFWNKEARVTNNNTVRISDSTYQDTIDEYVSTSNDNNYGYMYIAELFNDSIINRFGGQTEEAFENNLWLPAGESVDLVSSYDTNGNPIPATLVTVYYTEGDTFFQRYDCLKTYPYTLEDTNSVVDIVSFMCETRINLDGRYDKNRGQSNNLTMTPEVFNKVNNVYSQLNNFFNYRGLNSTKFKLNNFPSTVTWTKEKQLGSIIDTWSNITLSSTLDLDGDKGEIISLNTYNNEIYCFQRQGFSNILFNSRVQIPTSDGLPIEISNGMKVGGKRYISNTIGCGNKWSIVESPAGIYFIDNETNSLYIFNGQISSLSDKLGFRQWIGAHNNPLDWDPVNFNNYRSFYDKNNDDVYFVYRDHCLCYSELLGQFTSFMSYEKVPAIFNIGSDLYSFKDSKLWEQFAGDYNMFYNSYKPFSITVISNDNSTRDKIFNNVEFRSDSWNNDILVNKTFDTLDVWNEYQHGTEFLDNIIGHTSNLKNKFRVWRANIPRDNSNNRDRIRNTWAYIKLEMKKPNINKTVFHDMVVNYFT